MNSENTPSSVPVECLVRQGRDESKLPKWAQQLIASQRLEIERLKSLETAHAVLHDREWFTLFDSKEEFYLYRLFHDSAASLCSIGVGDVALIGRAKK